MDSRPVVVVDIVEPGVEPPYCCHGKATCIACDEWCWLGDSTFPLVSSGEADPLCMSCAVKYIPPDTEPIGHVEDHRRADGPHT